MVLTCNSSLIANANRIHASCKLILCAYLIWDLVRGRPLAHTRLPRRPSWPPSRLRHEIISILRHRCLPIRRAHAGRAKALQYGMNPSTRQAVDQKKRRWRFLVTSCLTQSLGRQWELQTQQNKCWRIRSMFRVLTARVLVQRDFYRNAAGTVVKYALEAVVAIMMRIA